MSKSKLHLNAFFFHFHEFTFHRIFVASHLSSHKHPLHFKSFKIKPLEILNFESSLFTLCWTHHPTSSTPLSPITNPCTLLHLSFYFAAVKY